MGHTFILMQMVGRLWALTGGPFNEKEKHFMKKNKKMAVPMLIC